MNPVEQPRVESEALRDFVRATQGAPGPLSRPFEDSQARPGRINFDPDDVKNGLGQLVLTLVKLLHELLERQAIRRIDTRPLNEAEIERLGVTLMRQAQEIERLRKEFGLEEEDLNLDLGPLGRLL
jgi:hypothetical protein